MFQPAAPSPLPLVEPLGDRGWLVHFSCEAEAAAWTAVARDFMDQARINRFFEKFEIVPAYRTVAIVCDPQLPDFHWREIHERIQQSLTEPIPIEQVTLNNQSELIEVPVVYNGPDLANVAHQLGLTEAEVVQEHTSQLYQVFAVGFLPGFPYAGYLPERISGLPRRSSPRVKVPAGSVAITGRQTGIYPSESPGGWHLLGQTEMTICDLKHGFFRFRPGDRVRFVATTGGVKP